MTVRSSDGFTFNLDVSQIIHIPRNDAPKVIARFGNMPNLVTQVLEPTIGNYFRNAAQGSDAIDFLKQANDIVHREAPGVLTLADGGLVVLAMAERLAPATVARLAAVLDTQEVTLKAGEFVVQRGTNHAWSNRSGKVCRILYVLIDGEFDSELAARFKPAGSGH